MYISRTRLPSVTILVLIAALQHAPAADTFVGSQAGQERAIAGVKLCWCPPGVFLMGSPPTDLNRRTDENQVETVLTKGFWIGKYEVTQAEWKRIVGDYPEKLLIGVGDNFPMHSVSYVECELFCARLTERGRAGGELPAGWEFKLPTEAQWEYACRAGTTSAFAFGDVLSIQQANIKGSQSSSGAGQGGRCRSSHACRHLPTQRLGPVRHAWQYLRMVSRLVSRPVARRR